MANVFKSGINRLMWVQTSPTITAHAIATSMAYDLRNDASQNPYVYNFISNTSLARFNTTTKAWQALTSPALAGTFGTGATSAFVPSFGAVGTIAAGATTTRFTLSTALPTAVALNGLATRSGVGTLGYKIRIIDSTAGKTEERYITSNTAGTTPTITVNSGFSFTPSTGARYELLAGRLFMLGASTLASGIFKSLEVATSTVATRSNTNLPATVSADSAFLVLDELYVPFDCAPGEGMVKGTALYDTGLNALVATATSSTTLTGQATGGDSVVVANEYRNFQIRIVQDVGNPAAVGQRRIIASHTAGASPAYTLGTAWTSTPSVGARYVIEQPNLLVLRSSATTTTYTYNYTDATINNGTNNIVADAWSTTYFSAGPANNAGGNMWMPSFGIQPNAARNERHSFNYFFRGGSVTTLDLFDIAGSITGTWTGAITYDGAAVVVGTGSTGTYSPFGLQGRYFYMNIYSATANAPQIYRFDVKNRNLAPYFKLSFVQTGGATSGSRMAAYVGIDGTAKYDMILLQAHLSSITQELIALV
jgi:hypothetical protein